MTAANESTYYRGTIEFFADRDGSGIIRVDPDEGINDLLRFRRTSLRRRDLSYRRGDRVQFHLPMDDAGGVPLDIHKEVDERLLGHTQGELSTGTIQTYFDTKHFGFIRLTRGTEVFFHSSALADRLPLPEAGRTVTCRVVQTTRGLVARDVTFHTEQPDTRAETYLARAVLARDARQYDEAQVLYERGLKEAPTPQLVLSYAAMERNRNRRDAAMRVYREGIRRFPTLAKLREDAGVLAASLGEYANAVQLLSESLALIRRYTQGGEKGVLLELARTHYKIGKEASLRECVRCYSEAKALFARTRGQMSPYHDLLMHLASIRLQHHRGYLAVDFLSSPAFEIVRARLLDSQTEAAEFVVRVDSQEFRDSYGLGQHILVRCMFKSNVSLVDLNTIEQSARTWAESGLGDGHVALLLVASLPRDLQGLLSRRIEEPGDSQLAIVPLQQAELEAEPDATTALRKVLDRWLYRRDLFAGSDAVQGTHFFGRAKQLAEIREGILSSAPLGVFGLRKVGKTSLLLESQRQSSERGDIVVYVDLLRTPMDAGGCRWLYWRICEDLRAACERQGFRSLEWELAGKFKTYLRVPPSFPVATAFDADIIGLIAHVRNASVQPRPKIVLMLDEVEFILPHASGRPGLTGYIDFLAHLRGLCQECKDFVFMVTAANPTISETSQFEKRDNPVFNYFRETYLQLLRPSECQSMIRDLGRGMGLRFTSDACDEVFQLTGGHPYFARQVCSFVAARTRERPDTITAARVKSLEDSYMEERGSKDLGEILDRLERDYPDELGICIDLAMAGGELPLETVRQKLRSEGGSTLRHLTGYQIARIYEPLVGLTMGLMSRWLQRKYSNGS